MKRRLWLVLVSCILLIIDNTFSPFIAVKGFYPNFLFTFSIAYAIVQGKKEGVILGIISGFFQDIYFFSGFGVNMLVNMLCCLISGIIGEGIWREKKLVPVITMFLVTLLKYTGIFVILNNLGIYIDISKSIGVGIYNLIVMIFIYNIVLKVFNIEDKKKTWRF